MTMHTKTFHYITCNGCGERPEYDGIQTVHDTEAAATENSDGCEFRALAGQHFCEDCWVKCGTCDGDGYAEESTLTHPVNCAACQGRGWNPFPRIALSEGGHAGV